MFQVLFLVNFLILLTESANVTVPRYSSGIHNHIAELTCTYTHLPGEIFTNMEWLRGPTFTSPNFVAIGGTHFNGSGSLISNAYIPEGYSFRSDLIGRSTLTFTVIIDNVQCDLEGDFRCRAKYRDSDNIERTIITDTIFQVKSFPSDPQIMLETSVVRENEEVVFTCESDVGKPAGSITWLRYRRDSNVPTILQSTKSTSSPQNCYTYKMDELRWIATREDHLSTVICRVEQELVQPDELTSLYGQLAVFHSPSTPVIHKSPLTNEIKLGDNYTLTCESDGYPEPSIKWYKNSVDVRSFKRFYIRNATKLNEAEYECVATNQVNGVEMKSNSSFTLSVIDGETAGSTGSNCQSKAEELSSYIPVVLVTCAVWIVVVIAMFIIYKCVTKNKQQVGKSFSRLSSRFSVRRREDPTVAFERNYQGLSIKERKGRHSGTYASAIFEDSPYLDIVPDDGGKKNKSIRGRSSGVYDSGFVPTPNSKVTPKRSLPPQPAEETYAYAYDENYLHPTMKY